MSKKRDIIEESADGLRSPASDLARKKLLVRRLVKCRGDRRVGLILQNQLAKETEPALIQVLILGMGALKDPEQIPHLLPFLEHSSLGVVAAAVKSLCKLDPSFESETAHPLMVAKDDRVRAASIMALLSFNTESGMNALRQLASSSTVALRKTALAVLSSSQREGFEEVLLQMFFAEQDPELLEAEIKGLAGGLTHLDRLKKVMEQKAEILSRKESDRTADSITGRKLDAISTIITSSYEKLELSGDVVGTLEGQVEKQIEGHRKTRETGKSAPPPPRRTNKKLDTTAPVDTGDLRGAGGGRILGRVIFVILVIGVIAMVAPGLLENPAPAAPPIGVVAPVTTTATTSLGQVGDVVTVEGRVVRLYPRLKVVLVELPDGAGLAYLKVPDKLPPVASEGNQVRAKGKIIRVESATAIHVETDKVVSASSLED